MLYNVSFETRSLQKTNLEYNDHLHLFLSPSLSNGTVASNPLDPKLGYQWHGFDVEGSKEGIAIAFISPSNPITYFSFAANTFTPSLTPQFCNVAEVRERLPYWKGAIRLLFKLTRGADGVSPFLAGYSIGCKTLGDPFSYLLSYGIPLLLSRKIRIERSLSTNGQGNLLVPPGFNPEKMSEVQFVTIPEKALLSGTVAGQTIKLSPSVVNKIGFLTFNYTLLVEPITGDGTIQISEVPSVYIKYDKDENIKNVMGDRWTTEAGGAIAHQLIENQRSPQFELSIVAQTAVDLRMIGQAIVSLIRREGSVYLPAYGKRVALRLVSTLKEGPKTMTPMIKESLLSATLQVEVVHWEDAFEI